MRLARKVGFSCVRCQSQPVEPPTPIFEKGLSISRRGSLLIGVGGAIACGSGLSLPERKALAADLAAAPLDADEIARFLGLEGRIHEFTLPNGLRFVILERHRVPIVSCYTFADVGAYEEEDGRTGLAHLLEHLAFKGTEVVGTRDYAREAPLLSALDEAFYNLRDAKQGGRTEEVARLQQLLAKLQDKADELVVPDAYGSLLEREGGVGLNAQTSQDETIYYVSLPKNKLPLWFALESERFAAPVFRQLYREKEVVLNERRLRVDLPPLGKYQEAFAMRAFNNNYRRPVIGFESDIEALGRREVDEFFKRHYGPSRLVVAIVGDVTPEEVRKLADQYFGSWSTGNGTGKAAREGAGRVTLAMDPGLLAAPGPPVGSVGASARELRWESPAGPLIMEGYYRPPSHSDGSVAIDVLCDVLGGGRTARFYSNLVLTGKALNASIVPTYPADKRSNMVLTYGTPGPGASRQPEELAKYLRAELDGIAAAGVQPAELQRVKKAARASLLEGLLSNTSMAGFLSEYTAQTGSWKNIGRDLNRIEALKAEEVSAAAANLFRPENRFTGVVTRPKGQLGLAIEF